MGIHVTDGAAQERDKYAEIWSRPEYRDAYSPGVENVDRFMNVMRPEPNSSIIDIGCGSGKAGLEFERRGLEVSYIDITDAGLDPAVSRRGWYPQPLWESLRTSADYGFCCDVLEHIPTEYTMLVCRNILSKCTRAWLQICNEPDNFGPALLGEPLHLTVRPFSWWLVRLATLGNVIEARDLCGTSLFVVSKTSKDLR